MEREKAKKMEMMKGRVIWFDKDKGFGFIGGEDGQDYFVHWRGIQEKFDENGKHLFGTLTENAKVRFEIEWRNGKKQAMNCIEIEENPPEKDGQDAGETGQIPEEKVM